jgi:LuxR family maltose regulon positive regulatory protein
VFDNLLQTKLTIPPVSASLVTRPSPAARLAAAAGNKLTLITAPAGYGKTTLLATWLSDLHSEEATRHSPLVTRHSPLATRQSAWLSLDPADDNPGRFCAYLLAALQTISPDIGRSAEPLLQGRQEPPPIAVMTALLNDLVAYDGSISLVIDDYHLITDTAVHEAMSLLIDQLPANIYFVIASRTVPPWPLARWRAKSQLVELTITDLQFSTDDTAVFLNDLMSLNLSANDIAVIAERAEGWVTGLKLISVAMRNNDVRSQWIAHLSGQHRFIFDYLAEEVFNQQPPDIQQFLLDTAVLERLTPDLCDALRGEDRPLIPMLPRPPASAILLQLERTNLFLLPLDEERHWYRFHHLFADFLLRQRQRLDPASLPGLHRRAAAWYQAHGYLDDALQHLLAIEAYPEMATLLEEYAPSRWTAARMGTLRQWLRRLPDDLIQANTHLALAYVSTLIDTFQLETAASHLHQLEQRLKLEIDDHIATDPIRAGCQRVPLEVFNEIIALRGAIAYFKHDAPAAQKLSGYMAHHLPADHLSHRSFFCLNLGSYHAWEGNIDKASEYLHEAIRAALTDDNRYLAYLAIGQLGYYQFDWGQLHQAARTFQQALNLTTHAPISGWIYSGLAQIHYEWNDLDTALTYILAGRERSRFRENRGILVANFLHHARILLTQGDIAGATALLNQATQLSQQAINPALIAMTTAVQAQIALASDEADKAISWAAQFLDPANVPEQETVCQTLAQIWLIQNRPDAVQQLMARLLATAVPTQNIRLIIRWQIAQALAHAAQQQPDEAVAHLAQAIQLGQAGGFMRSYLDWGQPCFNLLNQLAQTKGEVELETAVKRLLIAFREAGYQSLELPHLTPREQDVLQLIAAGLSNDDIAAELVVAKGTVKKHLDNIYGKLEVNSRTQALARAQELTLL